MIKLLIPDMPDRHALGPYLRAIDENRWYSNFGPLVTELERRLAEYFTACAVVTVSSGPAALELALEDFLSIDEDSSSRGIALMPSLTFPATATAALRASYDPALCDVDPGTWCMMPGFTNHYDVVIPVGAFGAPIHFGGSNVIIDAAGVFFKDQPCLAGAALCFSLHATKSIGAGEGGFVVSHDLDLIERIRARSNFGLVPHGDGVVRYAGTNAKLSEYHAPVALANLDRIDSIAELRREVHHQYLSALASYCPLQTQKRDPNGVYTLMPVLLPDLGDNAANDAQTVRVMNRLQDKKIETRRWYHPPLHRHPAFKRFQSSPLPITENISSRLIGLPFHTFLSEQDVIYVCRSLAESLK